MALIYDKLAILSVGLSCQTAHHIENQKDFVDGLVGQKSVHKRTPFDWLIAPAPGITKLLTEDRYFPQSPDELTFLRKKQYYWDRMRLWIFHETRIEERFDDVSTKFKKLKANLSLLEGKTVLAIWANTQNNLRPNLVQPRLDVMARQSELQALEQAITTRFPDSVFFRVTHPERHDATDPMPDGTYSEYDPPEGPQNWKGDDALWQSIFKQAISDPVIQSTISGQGPRLGA